MQTVLSKPFESRVRNSQSCDVVTYSYFEERNFNKTRFQKL